LTSGLYGREPSRREVTDRITQAERFEATSEFKSDVSTTLHDGDHHHKSNSKNWEKENSNQQTVNKVTINRGKVSSSRSVVFNELEMSTHYSTFTSTPPTGTPLTGTAHGAHLRVFHSTTLDDGPAKGFELTVGYNYDSMVQLIRPDGTSSHWQFYSSSTFFPEGGSSQPNPNLTSSDDDSYNPNSRRQDGEGDKLSDIEIELEDDYLYQLFKLGGGRIEEYSFWYFKSDSRGALEGDIIWIDPTLDPAQAVEEILARLDDLNRNRDSALYRLENETMANAVGSLTNQMRLQKSVGSGLNPFIRPGHMTIKKLDMLDDTFNALFTLGPGGTYIMVGEATTGYKMSFIGEKRLSTTQRIVYFGSLGSTVASAVVVRLVKGKWVIVSAAKSLERNDAALIKALGGKKDLFTPHHLIPVSLAERTGLRGFFIKAAREGWDMNGVKNGKMVDNLIRHVNSHPRYNTFVENEIRDYIKKSGGIKNLNGIQSRNFLEQLADRLSKLIDNTTGDLNLLDFNHLPIN